MRLLLSPIGLGLIDVSIDKSDVHRIAYLSAELVGGNSFKQVNEEIYEFNELQGQLQNLIIFFLFGATLLPQVWGPVRDQVGLDMIAYALLSLTLVRMLCASRLKRCQRRRGDPSSEHRAVAGMPKISLMIQIETPSNHRRGEPHEKETARATTGGMATDA
ncbi:MAG: hypothetical protein WBG92_05265 [Thiohalocapsa sp.]